MVKKFAVDGINEAKSVLLLTAGLIMAVTLAVGATGWTRGLSIVTFIGMGSILIGIMLARSILPDVAAHLFSLIIGFGWSFWVTSRLLPPNYSWLERWKNLMFRLGYWYNQVADGGISYDNLMFIFQMGMIIWIMGYLTIWLVFRAGKVWQAIIPGGLVLIINLYYAPNNITFWFLVYLMFALLLVVRFNLFNQETKWKAEGVLFRPNISLDFLRDGFIFSILVITIAWLTPPMIDARSLGLMDGLPGSWGEIQIEWKRLYANLNYTANQSSPGEFGTSLRLGGARTLTKEPVMDVKVEGIGRYWRAAVYDKYTGIGWEATKGQSASFAPDSGLSLPRFAANQPVTQTYTLYHKKTTALYAMNNLISLDRSAKVTFNAVFPAQTGQSSSPVWNDRSGLLAEDITYIRSNISVKQNESYQAVSSASYATIEQLKQSGNNYPAWIDERYLQLPNNITERTRQLANNITATFDNPFTKAQAVERYLRAKIRYNEKIAAPPPEVEKVDYILFEKKEAYCDYYATSMIVMLRTVGIPARLASGFAQGTYDTDKNAFHIRNLDAHSWVEVYFPQYGWIEFEPTAAQPNIIRPTATENENSFSSIIPSSTETTPNDNNNIGGGADVIPIDSNKQSWFETTINQYSSVINDMGIFAVSIIPAILLAGWYLWQKQQLRFSHDIFELYNKMIKLGRWMGVSIHSWQTPYEHAAVLQKHLPAYKQEVETIITEYVHCLFKPAQGKGLNSLTPESNQAWSRLYPVMVKAIFRFYLPEWLKR